MIEYAETAIGRAEESMTRSNVILTMIAARQPGSSHWERSEPRRHGRAELRRGEQIDMVTHMEPD